MTKPTYFKPLLASLAVAASAASTIASAAPVFTVNEGAVPGSLAQFVTADRITFGYTGEINQTINGGSLAGNDDPFVERGFFSKANFEMGGGTPAPSQLNANVATFGYGIYGLFTITGEADPFGPAGILATFNTAVATLWVDPNQDTTLSVGGTTGGAADDLLLANLTLTAPGAGQAHVFGGLANGDFDSFLNFALTPYGETYFVSPKPFFTVENFGGNTQTISEGASLTQSFVVTATGAGVELFINQVPEPGVLSLLGLGLVGVGVATRKKKIPS